MTQPLILVVDDEPDIRELVSEILEDEGYSVAVAEDGETARRTFAARTPDLVLLDIWMPDVDGISLLREWSAGGGLACPVVVMSGHGNVETAIEATRLGAHDFVQKPISLARLLAIVSQALEAGRKAEKSSPAISHASSEPIGSSALMQVLRGKAEQAAQHDLPVMITGERGSGRENLARFIHEQSNRQGPFVTLDPGELDGGSVREYLLGDGDHRDSGRGMIRAALGGTLFLPDLEEVSEEALRTIDQILDAGQWICESGVTDAENSCRLMVSAAPDIQEDAKNQASLQQLYFRLNVLRLELPPLRERPDDVPELVRFYAEWFPNAENLPYRAFSVAAQNRLRNHGWPGNVRELRNLVQRLLVLGGEGEVSVAEVEEALKQNPSAAADTGGGHPEFFNLPLREAREHFERAYLIYRLRQAGGSVGKLAESVGMERTHLYRKLRALGVDPKTAVAEGGPS
jgi:DNA-binding NtrC family response regulator